MAQLHHECGIAAVYHLPGAVTSPLCPKQGRDAVSRLIPRLLLDIQNRGQLAAGMTTWNPGSQQLIDTHKDVGTVTEVFHLNHEQAAEDLLKKYSGPAAIGHVRYATCGKDDRSYAQPFERHHIEKRKWFSFGFNGQLANYLDLRDEILSQNDFHLSRETDTEILMHLISQQLAKRDPQVDLFELLTSLTGQLDGAYNIVFLNALGDMFIARDPLGFRPLCYAIKDGLLAAASESVALANLGFKADDIVSLPPGHAIIVQDGHLDIRQFAQSPRGEMTGTAHCFFEWIYFANVASTLDQRSVYLSRKALGEELAAQETLDVDEDTIVVPVPDTAKAAADAMAYALKVPSLEGLIRNRYIGRTFIEGSNRADKAKTKYTPLPEVLRGKRVLLVEDTIVRSTTMRTLVTQLKERGGAKEVHVRVACPPIVAPCFYGIDMTTVDELFAETFLQGRDLTPQDELDMARDLEADTLRYLPVEAIARCVDLPVDSLCRACVTREYPTAAGRKLYKIALDASGQKDVQHRTLDAPLVGART